MIDAPCGLIVAVVDDDPRVLGSLERLLESADYTVRLFASSTAMLESGCLDEIDCLISDVGMPTMDGFELLQVARAARPALPVFLISGRSDAIARASGADGDQYRVFKKPFNGAELLAALCSVLGKPRVPGSSR